MRNLVEDFNREGTSVIGRIFFVEHEGRVENVANLQEVEIKRGNGKILRCERASLGKNGFEGGVGINDSNAASIFSPSSRSHNNDFLLSKSRLLTAELIKRLRLFRDGDLLDGSICRFDYTLRIRPRGMRSCPLLY
jgi:hypothetical protein